MRLTFSFLAVCCFALCACRSSEHLKRSQSGAEIRLTPSQMEYVRKYSVMRKKVTDFLKLPESASVEEIRPFVVAFLKLPARASWEDTVNSPLVRRFLTDERRGKCAAGLGLPPTATWVELGFAAERLRKEL